MSGFKSYDVNLHILSPVHIGAGQELDPFSYFIKADNLVLFDLLKWMERYENKEELNEKMDSEDYIGLRAYIAENFNNDDAILNSIPVKDNTIIQRYKKAMRDRNSENQALINFMTRNEITRIPYIPGGSIKGAIRTAIGNRFVASAGVSAADVKNCYKTTCDRKIFGNPLKDPMKNLKISDVSLSDAGSFIYEAQEFSYKPDKSPTPKGGFEASASLCELEAQVVIPLHFSLNNFSLLGTNIDLSLMVNILYDFYITKFKDEYKKFYHSAKNIQQAMAYINKEALNLKTNETFIRIGRFSHVECMTFDGVRKPKTRWKNDKPLPWGTTRTLANGIYPFGWVKLEFKDLPAQPRNDKNWPFSQDEVINAVSEKEKAKIIAAKRREDEEKKKIALKKRQAEIDAMSPEDKMIKEVQNPIVTEDRVYEIYRAMDSFPDNKKLELANALKEFWQKKNKWKKKKCSKNQWGKVLKIKEILNEN